MKEIKMRKELNKESVNRYLRSIKFELLDKEKIMITAVGVVAINNAARMIRLVSENFRRNNKKNVTVEMYKVVNKINEKDSVTVTIFYCTLIPTYIPNEDIVNHFAKTITEKRNAEGKNAEPNATPNDSVKENENKKESPKVIKSYTNPKVEVSTPVNVPQSVDDWWG